MSLPNPPQKRSATAPMMIVGFFGGVATVILVVWYFGVFW
jgi:hypothetical protein